MGNFGGQKFWSFLSICLSDFSEILPDDRHQKVGKSESLDF